MPLIFLTVLASDLSDLLPLALTVILRVPPLIRFIAFSSALTFLIPTTLADTITDLELTPTDTFEARTLGTDTEE